MRKSIIPIIVIALLGICLFGIDSDRSEAQTNPKPQNSQEKKIPDVIILARDTKQGAVTFNHAKHNSGEYTVDGKIACIECHHTAQPKSELAKHSPLNTEWPLGRTTTLTAELYAKDAKLAGVAACRDCHAKVGEKPKLLPEIPVLKDPGSTTMTRLTNQMAFHDTCDVCHFKININRPGSKAPNSVECWTCHKKAS
jgi:hypothetical protein